MSKTPEPFEAFDEHGNHFWFGLESLEKYPSRYYLKFKLNGKDFQIQFFTTRKDAFNFWDLVRLSAEEQKEENTDAEATN